jgi:hypothetical protein
MYWLINKREECACVQRLDGAIIIVFIDYNKNYNNSTVESLYTRALLKFINEYIIADFITKFEFQNVLCVCPSKMERFNNKLSQASKLFVDKLKKKAL